MTVIYDHTSGIDQTIRVSDDASMTVVPSGCGERPVTVDVPHNVNPAAALGLVQALLVATGMDDDYEIALKPDAESGSAGELAAGRALVAAHT